MDLRDATVLLTGATGGIGQAVARACAARGARLLLTGRRSDVLEPLAAETGGTAIPCDLADRGAVESLIADHGAGVEVLIANAALPASGPLLEYTPEQIDRALDVNLRAPVMLARRLAEGMSDRGRGHLVFVSSISGKVAAGGSSLYSATKFGMRGFALGLREDLREDGVGVSTIFPGFIRDAGMFAESGAQLPRYVGTRTADDVARAVIEAIERNKAEVDVAPLSMRLGAAVAGLAPETTLAVQRRLGGAGVAEAIAEGQRSKR